MAPAWPELWVPVALMGHAFAVFWLLKGLLTTHPTLLHTCLGWCCRTKACGHAGQVGGEAKANEEADLVSLQQHVQVHFEDCGANGGSTSPLQPHEPSVSCHNGLPSQPPRVATRGRPPADAAGGAGLSLDHARWTVAVVVGLLEWRNLGCSYKGAGRRKTVLQVRGEGG